MPQLIDHIALSARRVGFRIGLAYYQWFADSLIGPMNARKMSGPTTGTPPYKEGTPIPEILKTVKTLYSYMQNET